MPVITDKPVSAKHAQGSNYFQILFWNKPSRSLHLSVKSLISPDESTGSEQEGSRGKDGSFSVDPLQDRARFFKDEFRYPDLREGSSPGHVQDETRI